MAYPTPIEWCDATWTTVGGCEIHSPGCINCYAQRLAGTRLKHHPLYAGTTKVVKGKHVFNGLLTALDDGHPAWSWPIRWRGAKHPKLGPGKPSLIFADDMSDVFHRSRWTASIDRVTAGLVYSRHIGLLLTKRPDVMAAYFEELRTTARWFDLLHPILGTPSFDPASATWQNSIMPRLWLGWSAERPQEMYDRQRHMRRFAEAGWQTFVSIEPLLERTILPSWFGQMPRKPWVIVGGESGPDARPMHPDWVRELRDHAGEMGCPFFFKQWGEWKFTGETWFRDPSQPDREVDAVSVPEEMTMEDGKYEQWAWAAHTRRDAWRLVKTGKAAAGRVLDGREHNSFPTP